MKHLIAFVLVLAMCAGLSACRMGNDNTTDPSGTSEPAATSALNGKSLTEIVDLIYTKHPMELSLVTVPVELSDSYAVKSYLGLDSGEKVSEAVASESAFGSQAYSLVLCRVKNSSDAQAVARQMFEGIDQRKWICANADDLMVSVYGDLVMLVMIGSEYEDTATARQLTEAFSQVCGCRPELTLED